MISPSLPKKNFLALLSIPKILKPFHSDKSNLVRIGPKKDGGYVIDNKYIGQQRFMIKWAEYGYGWWEGEYKKMFGKSLQQPRQGKKPRKFKKNIEDLNIKYLGDKLAVVFINIEKLDTPFLIKAKMNAAISGGQYYVLNGEWPVLASDVRTWIDDNYDKVNIKLDINSKFHYF